MKHPDNPMRVNVFIDGYDRRGKHVEVAKVDGEWQVLIDGRQQEIVCAPIRQRDGGTVVLRVRAGAIEMRHKLDGDRRCFIDGELILPTLEAHENPPG